MICPKCDVPGEEVIALVLGVWSQARFPIVPLLPLGSSMLYALHPHLHRQSCEEFCRIRRHEASSRESSSLCRGGVYGGRKAQALACWVALSLAQDGKFFEPFSVNESMK